jgi:U3 small nucleolar ribonucleoprotein component
MTSELEKFDTVLRKVMSVSRDEMQKREKEWQRKQARKKRARTSPASRVSAGKD